MKTDVEAKKQAGARRRAAVRRGFLGALFLAALALGANVWRSETTSRVSTIDISALEAPASTAGVVETLSTVNVEGDGGSGVALTRAEAKAERIKRRVVANAEWLGRKIQTERAPLASELARRWPRFFAGSLRPTALLEAFLYCVIVAIISAFLNLASRILRGASPAYLLKTRFYEIPEIRVPLRVFRLFCWAFVGAWAFLTFRFVAGFCRDGGTAAAGAFALFAIVA
ncbi:MAG: hypothetical protein IKW13_07235, partial [Thermoguttaceae bacterium]|nr:hypothetical protein [Thermoguttaceae bacterium]